VGLSPTRWRPLPHARIRVSPTFSPQPISYLGVRNSPGQNEADTMRNTRIMYGGLAAAAVMAAAGLGFASRGEPVVEQVDFGVTTTATTPVFDARVAPVTMATVREFRIPMTHRTIEIAPGVKYDGWTFGNTVPGPVVRGREGDLVRITLMNESNMPHSIDFHSARIPMDQAFKTIGPGEELEFEFTANDPGAYMVHCGTPPVLMHIMQG